MVNIEFEVEDYKQMEKWFGLLFGTDGDRKPTDNDVKLFNKISQMHIAKERQNEIDRKILQMFKGKDE